MSIRDVQELVAAIEGGVRPRFVHFLSHRPPTGREPGTVGPECLSQWHPSPFTSDGTRYATAEHWMMAEKARCFGDEEAATAVIACTDPAEAKRIGRGVRGFDDARWTAVRDGVVRRGNELKFGQHPRLAAFLLGTGDAVLVEASPRDRVWGIGLGAADPDASDPTRWRGLNRLGFALMAVREELRTAAGAASGAEATP